MYAALNSVRSETEKLTNGVREGRQKYSSGVSTVSEHFGMIASV